MPVNNPTKCEDCGGFLEFDNTTRKAVCPTCEWRSRSTPTQQGAPSAEPTKASDILRVENDGKELRFDMARLSELSIAERTELVRRLVEFEPPSSGERRCWQCACQIVEFEGRPSHCGNCGAVFRASSGERRDAPWEAAYRAADRAAQRMDDALRRIVKRTSDESSVGDEDATIIEVNHIAVDALLPPPEGERRDAVTDATITDLVRRIEHVAALNRADSTCVVPRELLMSIRARLLWAASEHAGATDADECLCGHPRDGHEALSEDGAFIEAWGACSVGCGCLCYTTTGQRPSSEEKA